MYCKKCGKCIGTDDDLCYECKSAELMEQRPVEPQTQPVAYTQPTPQPAQEGNTMAGFGKALAGAIVGELGFILMYVGLIQATNGLFVGTLLLIAIALACGVLSLVFGIQSIKCFKREKAAGRKKPIPALVLGIISAVSAGVTLLYVLCFFIGFIIGMLSVA